MKSAVPYLGVQTPDHRRICRAIFRANPLDSFQSWRDTVLTLWRTATYREERYAAIALAAFPRYRDFRTLRALPLYKEMITTGRLVGLRRRHCYAPNRRDLTQIARANVGDAAQVGFGR